MLRKFYATVLLITCCLPLLFLLFMKIQQNQAQKAMKEKMEGQVLLNVVIPQKDIVWVKKNKEILFQGRMFDIKTISLKDDRYHLTGLFDDKETELARQWQQEQSRQNEKGNVLVVAFIQLFYFSSGSSQDIVQYSTVSSLPADTTWPLSDRADLVLTPPPQSVVYFG